MEFTRGDCCFTQKGGRYSFIDELLEEGKQRVTYSWGIIAKSGSGFIRRDDVEFYFARFARCRLYNV